MPSTLGAPAKIINEHPGVSHNYLRNHDFNMWFTVAVEEDSTLGLQGTLDVLAGADGRGVRAPAADAQALQDPHGPRDAGRHRGPRQVRRRGRAGRDRAPALRRVRQGRHPRHAGRPARRLRALRRPRPRSSASASTSSSSTSTGWSSARLLRRVAAILFHRRAGFSANGMGVWKVPEDRVLEIGPRMAAFRGISHCYQRPTYADWPYQLFTMAHGRSKEECDAILDAVAGRDRLHRGPRDALQLDRVQEGPAAVLHRRLQELGTRARGERLADRHQVGRAVRASAPAAARWRQLAGPRDAGDRPRPDLHRARRGRRDRRRRRQPLRRLRLLVGTADPRARPPGDPGRGPRGGGQRARRSARRPQQRSSSPRRSRGAWRPSRCCA